MAAADRYRRWRSPGSFWNPACSDLGCLVRHLDEAFDARAAFGVVLLALVVGCATAGGVLTLGFALLTMAAAKVTTLIFDVVPPPLAVLSIRVGALLASAVRSIRVRMDRPRWHAWSLGRAAMDGSPERRLPPGQRSVEGYPRFGTHLYVGPPPIPSRPTIEVVGAVASPTSVSAEELAQFPRREQLSDFHCVAGWSAIDLRWEGVPFAEFYDRVVRPQIGDGTTVTHLVFVGLDGYRAVVELRDALNDDVVIAQNLNGRPLDTDHGAPLRLVSPSQYGFVSAKHLCKIEVHTAAPAENYGHASRAARLLMLRPLFDRHPRSRVWQEERNARLPSWLVRPVYRAITPPIRWASGWRRSSG